MFWMDDGEMSRAPKGRMEDLFKNNRCVFPADYACKAKILVCFQSCQL
jgi:hypothetical protein